MYILNLEDNIYKHYDICKALRNGGLGKIDIECVGNLEDGIRRIKEQIDLAKPYDLIITDMWYPERPGEKDTESGEILIKKVKDNGWDIPIILCSSVMYRYKEILGSVHYSEKEDWENELTEMIKRYI